MKQDGIAHFVLFFFSFFVVYRLTLWSFPASIHSRQTPQDSESLKPMLMAYLCTILSCFWAIFTSLSRLKTNLDDLLTLNIYWSPMPCGIMISHDVLCMPCVRVLLTRHQVHCCVLFTCVSNAVLHTGLPCCLFPYKCLMIGSGMWKSKPIRMQTLNLSVHL